MAKQLGKQQYKLIDGTPEKRLFLSIISDYDLQTGLCELIDNAIDLWTASGLQKKLRIEVLLDYERQLISVHDNAGGIKESELRLLVSPGASGNSQNNELIGIFGVGGKRAGVALGELVEIRTRYKTEKSHQIDINNDWLRIDDWHLAAYEISDISAGTTIVDISKLRRSFDENDVSRIRTHLSETYAQFLAKGCELILNSEEIAPITFDHWAYPPEFLPRVSTFKIAPDEHAGEISVEINAGLILDRNPEAENYGVYFYCNQRLIAKEVRNRDVGYFISGEAGVPHPDASLCRVVVKLQGPGTSMPWNSSKSAINFNHPTFLALRSKLIELVKYFTSLSRRLKNSWTEDVFPHRSGVLETISEDVILSSKKLILPALPRSRKLSRIDEIKFKNEKILQKQPWTLGLVEALGLVAVISKQNLETKNRAALILLDSNFEIALKEFIVNRADLFPPHKYNDAKIADIFSARHKVITEVTAHVSFSAGLLAKVRHFYNLRNKLIHERATVGITDAQVSDCQNTIELVLTKLFKLRFPAE